MMCGDGWVDACPAREPDWVGERKKEGNKREVINTEPFLIIVLYLLLGYLLHSCLGLP